MFTPLKVRVLMRMHVKPITLDRPQLFRLQNSNLLLVIMMIYVDVETQEQM